MTSDTTPPAAGSKAGKHFILDGRTAVPVDLMAWAAWFEDADRTIAKTTNGSITVSTVFLGLDHQFGDGPPLIFETLVFGGRQDGEGDRYSTFDEAEAGHKAIAAKVWPALAAAEPARDTGQGE